MFDAPASIAAHGYALVVDGDPAAFRAAHGVPASVPIYGPFLNGTGLDRDGETVELSRPGDPDVIIPYIAVDAVRYDDNAPWPTTPDGDGPSLERVDPTTYGNDVANWQASENGGTPGWLNGAGDPYVTAVA